MTDEDFANLDTVLYYLKNIRSPASIWMAFSNEHFSDEELAIYKSYQRFLLKHNICATNERDNDGIAGLLLLFIADVGNDIIEGRITIKQWYQELLLEKARLAPNISNISTIPEQNANKTSFLEKASWIAGILALIISILMFFKIWPFG